MTDRPLRRIAAPFMVPGPTGVSVRTRLKGLTAEDELLLRAVGAHLGSLASADLKARCVDGLEGGDGRWAERKRALTAASSSRWAGAITKATNQQWALARRNQFNRIADLESAVSSVRTRLARPLNQPGSRSEVGGYRSRQEWHLKRRRLAALEVRLEQLRAVASSGRVQVVRGGKDLLRQSHLLGLERSSTTDWRGRWEAARWFLEAPGDSTMKFGNETIRVSPEGEVVIRLPNPFAGSANSPHHRYKLTGRAVFVHRGDEWRERVRANRAVAYRIHLDPDSGRWYVTASWQPGPRPPVPLADALRNGCIGVDMNADHLAAWRLDRCGNPVREPRRFGFDLSGTADHRDAQIRHALTRLLHWVRQSGAWAIAVEDLDFGAEKGRERHGRQRQFRDLITRFPTAKLRNRLASMADAQGVRVVAVDPAYTSKWGVEHWRRPMTGPRRKTTRHDAASIVIGRRAQGFRARRRKAPPRVRQSDGRGHRTDQAGLRCQGLEATRPPDSRPHTRCAGPGSDAKVGGQCAQRRSERAVKQGSWKQEPLRMEEDRQPPTGFSALVQTE